MSLAGVLGRVPSGLYVLTARRAAEETGMLVSWVMQAGFEPPMITIALRKERPLCDWLSAGEPFVLNLLSHEQKQHVKHFARGFDVGMPAFEGLELSRSGRGLPILTGAVGHLECTPQNHLDSADHRIFLAEVTGGELQHEERPVVHIRKNGMHY
jgi:flavin reductase (DIM6/NTAB) family NADH-FMN oxidoreductase RutF